MTATQLKHGPCATATPKSWPNMPAYLETCGVEDRMALVSKSTDAEWLEAVIALPGVQKTVKRAAERRLRWVNKAVKRLIANYKDQNREVAS